MANQMFCSSCGAGYTGGNTYCPMCGISVSAAPAMTFSRQHQMHCTGCGAKTGPRDTYCTVCGVECGEYVPQTGFAGAFSGSFGGANISGGASSIASGIKDYAPNLSQMKDKSVFAPAIVFALVSIAVGLILSFILDSVISGALRKSAGGLLGADMNISIGPVLIWLLTCLGGLSATVRVAAQDVFSGGASSASMSFALGIILLAVVPVVSLIIGRVARKAFIGAQHPGKEIRTIDALCAALVFAIVNVILSFFPSGIGSAINRTMADNGMGDAIKVSIGTRFIPLFLFSFIVAFILAMPSIKDIISGSVGARSKTASLSCAAGASFAKNVLLCGVVSAVVMFAYLYIKAGNANVINSLVGVGTSNKLLSFLMTIASVLNAGVWLASIFTGGSIAVSGDTFGSSTTIGAFGINSGGNSINPWPGGFLLLIAGLWIAVTVLYKLLRNEKLEMKTVIGVIAVPAVVTFIISSCTTIGGSVSGKSDILRYIDLPQINMTLTTASIMNLILCAVFMAIAVGVVHFSKRSAQLDNIISKLATTPFACAATAVATLITCLTVKGVF